MAGSLCGLFRAGAEEVIPCDVLIASVDSRFKNAVVSEIGGILSQAGYSVKKIDLKNILDELTRDYRAIIILDTCWAGRETRITGIFAEKIKARNKTKLVVLTTAKDENWRSKIEGVDAVTSASKMNGVQKAAEEIISKLKLPGISGR